MPVNLLLCEGAPGSLDVRVLSKLLSGSCGEIRPMGGKYGMGTRIMARREALGGNTVFGLLDGDFRDQWKDPTQQPVSWIASDRTHLGWRWERKEIENYLLDPDVVSQALRRGAPDPGIYRTVLESARDRVLLYQAARTALSAVRPRFHPLVSSFGPTRGKARLSFPDDLTEDGCCLGIENCVKAYRESQFVKLDTVLDRFRQYRTECEQGGQRHQHFMVCFAGKDLAWAANDDLVRLGFGSCWAFLEKVAQGIVNASEDIGDWLPEWKAMQGMVAAA